MCVYCLYIDKFSFRPNDGWHKQAGRYLTGRLILAGSLGRQELSGSQARTGRQALAGIGWQELIGRK